MNILEQINNLILEYEEIDEGFLDKLKASINAPTNLGRRKTLGVIGAGLVYPTISKLDKKLSGIKNIIDQAPANLSIAANTAEKLAPLLPNNKIIKNTAEKLAPFKNNLLAQHKLNRRSFLQRFPAYRSLNLVDNPIETFRTHVKRIPTYTDILNPIR